MKKPCGYILILLTALILACDSDLPAPGTQNHNQKIKYTETILGGCFLKNLSSREKYGSEPDTVYYSLKGKELLLHVGLNYNCCGQLSSQIDLNKQIINISITDICQEYCQCYCICHFTFDYKFSIEEENELRYNIWLKGYNESDYTLFRSGSIYLQ
jgi:hypothetical protein